MKILLSWLNELVPVGDDIDAIVQTLDDLGLAVDAVRRIGTPIPGVIVARVLATRRHPNADKIQLVDVDTGDGQPLQICCGAFNMQPGDLVPLATVGTRMPDGRLIQKAKLRGEISNGMLCSGHELGLGEDTAGILILPADLPLGADAFEAMGISEEVVFDLDLTRNRPDCWGHLGVARDLAARLGLPLHPPPAPIEEAGPTTGVTVRIDDPQRCGRFTGRLVTGVEVKPSPRWLADRLLAAGMRPINNVVDASNLVMLELNRPNHAYDLAKLAGPGFVIRAARDGETLVTLDGVERTFTARDCLICDATGAPIGIGGIMGGASTEIDDTTTAVVLEQAWFDPSAIAGTASRLGLRTEASARFERGCDPDDTDLGARRFVELLRLTCPDAQLHGPVVADGILPDRSPISVRVPRVNALLGTDLDAGDIKALLDPIGFTTTVEQHDPQLLRVALPSWRPDATAEVDVIEEVARHHGYGRIPVRVARGLHGGLSPLQRDRRLVREVLVGCGAAEAMPNPFLAPDDLERCGLPTEAISISNPLVTEESVLRTSLLPGLVKAVAYNASHRSTGVRLFEIGHTFRVPPPGQQLPDEREIVAVALAGAEAPAAVAVWDEVAAALAVEGVRLVAAGRPGLHPTRTAELRAPDGTVLGAVGEIDPWVLEAHGISERVAWLEFELAALCALPHGERRYRPVSRFPSSDIDLAFVVPDRVPAADVEDTVRTAGGPLVVDVRLFDVYRGPGIASGARSLAFTLRLQAPDRTLTDADVAEVRQRCVEAVRQRHDAELRA